MMARQFGQFILTGPGACSACTVNLFPNLNAGAPEPIRRAVATAIEALPNIDMESLQFMAGAQWGGKDGDFKLSDGVPPLHLQKVMIDSLEKKTPLQADQQSVT